MSLFVIFIVLGSTVMHAGWNLLARYERSETIFYGRMLVAITLLGFVPAIGSEIVTRSLSPVAWICAITSGLFLAVYFLALARAFESLDFTVVYPVARALPVIFIAFIDVLRERYLTAIGWLGIVLVAAGCFLVPLHSFRDIAPRRYFNRATMWMLIAALSTVAYTLLDKIAAEIVQQDPATAARYGYLTFAVAALPYLALVRATRARNKNSNSMGWTLAVPAAMLSFGAYWLVLWAYQLSPYASYIVAFRQFSIVIGAILAFILYKEQGVAVRLTGALSITFGLVLIGGWGR